MVSILKSGFKEEAVVLSSASESVICEILTACTASIASSCRFSGKVSSNDQVREGSSSCFLAASALPLSGKFKCGTLFGYVSRRLSSKLDMSSPPPPSSRRTSTSISSSSAGPLSRRCIRNNPNRERNTTTPAIVLPTATVFLLPFPRASRSTVWRDSGG